MHAKKIIEGQQHGLHVMQFSTVRVEAPLLCKANSTFIHSNSRSFYVFPFFFFFLLFPQSYTLLVIISILSKMCLHNVCNNNTFIHALLLLSSSLHTLYFFFRSTFNLSDPRKNFTKTMNNNQKYLLFLIIN